MKFPAVQGDTVKVERHGHVLLMGLNDPLRYNRFSLEMYHELSLAYGLLDSDPELRCGVIHGIGDNFTIGLDLPQWLPVLSAGKLPVLAPGAIEPFGLDSEKRTNKPIVAAAQGRCYTVAIELMLAADVRVVASNASFGQLEVKHGLFPVGGATVRLMHEIGWGNAMRYILTGEEFSAVQAFRMGFAQEFVQPGEQLKKAIEMATTIASRSPEAVQTAIASSRMAYTAGAVQAINQLFPMLEPILQRKALLARPPAAQL
jgi:enoyl-CoA hydratase/carnithine racemase